LAYLQVAAVVIVVDSLGNVLLTRRAASMRSYPGCWVLPGGGVDAGESLAAAAAREVWEETGLRCAPHGPVAAWESAFPLTPATFAEAGGKLRVHTLMVAFAARVAGNRPPLKLQPAEVDVATWVAPAELAALLDGTMSAPHAPAALQGEDCAPAQPHIAAQQLLGVYPNGLTPPEGLGLAHHYTLTVWGAAGCPSGAPLAEEGAPAAA
jgi:8-oxo-dGTP pyrophosphatase MutT (NUDIX family)